MLTRGIEISITSCCLKLLALFSQAYLLSNVSEGCSSLRTVPPRLLATKICHQWAFGLSIPPQIQCTMRLTRTCALASSATSFRDLVLQHNILPSVHPLAGTQHSDILEPQVGNFRQSQGFGIHIPGKRPLGP